MDLNPENVILEAYNSLSQILSGKLEKPVRDKTEKSLKEIGNLIFNIKQRK